LASDVPAQTDQRVRVWNDNYWWGEQGRTPHCVGYAWAHWLSDGPIIHPRAKLPTVDPVQIYRTAQTLDEMAGENYHGTTVRGGAKTLVKLGLIHSYYWAGNDFGALCRAVLEVGPVVVGTDWYEGMLNPSKTGMLRMAGRVIGGHCYVLNGINMKTGAFRLKNSWGRRWGIQGRAQISFADMQRLLRNHGDACLATEYGYYNPKDAA
jgi:hypothetical protein